MDLDRNRQALAGFMLIAYGTLAYLSRESSKLDLTTFSFLMLLLFAGYTVAYGGFKTPLLSPRFVWTWALLFRLAGMLGNPVFEDDFYRYLWDGYRFANDGSPYGLPPEAFFEDGSVDSDLQAVLSGINHPDIPTIYGPTLQYFFLAANRVAEARLWPLQALLIGIDMVTIGSLLKIAGSRKALLYAWNPLVIKEIAFTAHPDGLVASCLIGGWMLILGRYRVAAGFVLAAAVAAKILALLLVPFMLLRAEMKSRLAFAFGCLMLYGPFWLQHANDADGLLVFARDFEFNSALFALVTLWLPADPAKGMLALSYLLFYAVYFNHYRKETRPILPRGDWLMGGLLLISPVINPWYLLWLLPFASVYPSCFAWVASGAVLLSYYTGLNLETSHLGPYEHPVWVRPVEFGIIAVALACDIHRYFRGNRVSL